MAFEDLDPSIFDVYSKSITFEDVLPDHHRDLDATWLNHIVRNIYRNFQWTPVFVDGPILNSGGGYAVYNTDRDYRDDYVLILCLDDEAKRWFFAEYIILPEDTSMYLNLIRLEEGVNSFVLTPSEDYFIRPEAGGGFRITNNSSPAWEPSLCLLFFRACETDIPEIDPFDYDYTFRDMMLPYKAAITKIWMEYLVRNMLYNAKNRVTFLRDESISPNTFETYNRNYSYLDKDILIITISNWSEENTYFQMRDPDYTDDSMRGYVYGDTDCDIRITFLHLTDTYQDLCYPDGLLGNDARIRAGSNGGVEIENTNDTDIYELTSIILPL